MRIIIPRESEVNKSVGYLHCAWLSRESQAKQRAMLAVKSESKLTPK